jgi:hypothetical protein
VAPGDVRGGGVASRRACSDVDLVIDGSGTLEQFPLVVLAVTNEMNKISPTRHTKMKLIMNETKYKPPRIHEEILEKGNGNGK